MAMAEGVNLMNIYRPINGIYRCINNPRDKRAYVLLERKGHYPVLVPIQDADRENAYTYPIPEFMESADCGIAAANEGQGT